jgi:hydrogenase expression/formation protein HypD
VENQYARAVAREGNLPARRMIGRVFQISNRGWRGIGEIPLSGYCLSDAYRDYDADSIFDVGDIRTREPEICIAGQVLRGLKKPMDCPAFGSACTPQTPLGATMVSAEGACAAYFNYGRHLVSIRA